MNYIARKIVFKDGAEIEGSLPEYVWKMWKTDKGFAATVRKTIERIERMTPTMRTWFLVILHGMAAIYYVHGGI